MKKLLIAILVGLFFVGCFEGPMGPEGAQGEQGDQGIQGQDGQDGQDGDPGPGSFWKQTGILSSSTLVDSLYWNIGSPIIEDFVIIQPYTRIGTGYLWLTPDLWMVSFDNGYIRIFLDNFTVQIGNEYLIIMCSPDRKEEMEEYVRGLNENM